MVCRPLKMRTIVAYDISNDRNRKKVSELLGGVLTRVQFSVFEGEVPTAVLQQVIRKVLKYLDGETDSVRVYSVCAACERRIDAYGRNTPADPEPVRIL